MSEIKNSIVLEKMIGYATTLSQKSTSTFTAELFIVSVIDVIKGGLEMENQDSKEIDALASIFNGAVADNLIDVEQLRSDLMSCIDSKSSTSFLDGVYMQKKMMQAKTQAGKNGQESLTADVLLACIIRDPDEKIKKYFSNTTHRIPTVEDTPELSESDIKKFDEMLRKSKKKQKDEPTLVVDKEKNPKDKIAEITEFVKKMRNTLSETVYGQENAISVFTSGYFQAELTSLTNKEHNKPKATFLFAGPPGVGKTFLAETVAKKLLGIPYQRFDMSEYCDKEASVEFIGSDSVYKGSKQGNFTKFVNENPECVILFDEIEKAHISIIHLFLQILDAGVIRDSQTDKEISLRNTILIFTTNAGKQLYENSESRDFSGVSRKVILKALQKDINPATNQPFFPAAICSRFASGNVVMFNHLGAHDLREMAKREILKQSEALESSTGTKIEIDDSVYTAVLFAEGGLTDGRTISARAVTFFNEQLFELFRLVASGKTDSGIQDIEKIRITVDLPEDNKEIRELFSGKGKPEVLLFAPEKVSADFASMKLGCSLVRVDSEDEIVDALSNHDIKFVLIDPSTGKKQNSYLNIEDEDSEARNAFWLIKERYCDLPIFVLENNASAFNEEERQSFIQAGVSGFVTYNGTKKAIIEQIKNICESIRQQESIINLASANKVATFETAQTLLENGKVAEIKLFDFELSTAVEAEDGDSILSNLSKPNVRFKEVIGAEDAKTELQYFANYLRNPKKYLGTGVSAPKGVILYGPPGTGKTMLAKAMACESDVTFISEEGNKFIQGGPERVHQLFATARKYAPSILFVDEIDAIAKNRTGGVSYSDDILTAFLTEMDGFKNDPSKPVFVLAATNFDVEPGSPKSLGPALMRRFDRRIFVDLPNQDERLKYLRGKVSANKTFDVSKSVLENIALRSTGMSLAELASVFELALRSVVRTGAAKVTDEILEDAFETFNSGEVKKWDESELLNTARHEAGHAFISWKCGDTPAYITIVSRGNYGGYVRPAFDEKKMTHSKQDLLNRIRTALGGRAAELVYNGEEDGLTTGASSDLIQATTIAQRIICSYGMDKTFGLAVIDEQAARMFELSSDVRKAVNAILEDEMQKAISIITENRQAIDALVSELMKKNHLSGSEIDTVLKPFAN